jgi:asparagine synthase (glutamine-hydrolysing)
VCGIAGYISFKSEDLASSRIGEMVRALARRGPDSEGISTWPGVALGHRRLAILDLSPAGHQPMLSPDGNIGLVFNGCIYNFLELRTDLERLGYRFCSHTDTEVLLAGYQRWGVDELVRRCRGMYAFAIWDEPRKRLTLVRDRLGVKPLLWAEVEGGIAFASTGAALRTAGAGSGLDELAAEEFLEYGFVTDQRCIWRGIHKLPAAGILEWFNGRIEQRTYWDIPEQGTLKISFEDAVQETERLLVEAVKLRLCADVPIGALLSGGVDSALVCWAMREAGANVKAFTVGTPGDPADETAAAEDTARRLQLDHEIVEMGPQGPLMDLVLEAFSEPFGCQSAHALLAVSKAVKPHATVLLTGDGGDDIFFGYDGMQNLLRAQNLAARLPDWAGGVWRGMEALVPRFGALGRARHFLDYATGGLPAIRRRRTVWRYFENNGVFGPRLKEIRPQLAPESMAAGRRILWDYFAEHRRLHFTSEFMPKVDGSTMHYALEARAPFLDTKLWEFAATLPGEVRLHKGELKAVLREIVRRRVGGTAATRAKQGFTVPGERWLAGRWAGALDILRGGRTELEQGGWVRPGCLIPLVNQAIQDEWVPAPLWHLVVLEHWLQHQGSRTAPRTEAVPAAVRS